MISRNIITSVRSMMNMTISGKIFIAAAFCGFVALFVYHFKKRHLYWAASQLPGPLAFPIFGNGSSFIGNTNDILTSIVEMMSSYTSPCRFWLGPKLCIATSDAEQVKTILVSQKALDKPHFFQFAKIWLGNGLLTASASHWHRRRKLVMPAFNSKILKSFVKVFCQQSEIMTIQMRKELHCGEFDVAAYLSLCSLDMICETIMGVSLKAQTAKHCRYHSLSNRLLEILFMRMIKVWLYPDFIFYRTKLGREQVECVEYMQNMTSEIIRKHRIERRTDNEESPDDKLATNKGFLDLMMEQTDDNTQLTDDELREEINTIIIAASDSTSTINVYIMLMLATHPEVQDKVFQELCDIYGDEVCSERPVVIDDLSRMEYLDRVIKETIRLFPAGPMIGRLITEDLDLGKCTLPKGSIAILPIIMIHRSEQYWSDPLKFDPNRFLPEEVAKRHPDSYMPFSIGPRICIGRTYAMISMKVLIATVLRRYVLIKDKIVNVNDIKLKMNFVVKPQESVTIRISERRYPEKLCKENNGDDVKDDFRKCP